MIPLTPEHREAVRRHAAEAYPFECCGIVLGKAAADDILFRCTNIQDKLHQKDPRTFTRDARTAFYIDPKELMGILKQAREQEMAVKVFYHSHPDHEAYFSEEDERMALFDGEPLYPGAGYLVVSVYDRKIKDEAFFSWDPGVRKFERQND